ncbi:MAG: gamma-glutamyltransferase [Gemmatimonadaceae bacterium]
MHLPRAFAVAALCAGCGGSGSPELAPRPIPSIATRRLARFAASWPHPGAATRVAFAVHGMVASNSIVASEVGAEIMRRGGNAVDAAVAVGFALAVTHPEAGNIGGGGYMVIRMSDGRTAALDYREVAPLAATRDMYVDATGALTDKSLVGPLAAGIPGAVAGMAAALERFGTMPLRTVMEPAIRLAREGFIVDSALHRSLVAAQPLLSRFGGADVFYPGEKVPEIGSRFVQSELARTLALIAERGPAVFYTGEIADSVAAEMARSGGIITRTDLARYRPLWRTPLVATYRGHTLVAMPLSSSGGVTMTETLNILETYDSLPSFGSAQWAHVLASAYQRAFVDRNTKLGDPEFVTVPVGTLTSKGYARALRTTIPSRRATPTSDVGHPPREGTETTHYSVVDGRGNAVATTTTINNLYGSGVVVRGTGFLLNDEMDDFAARPGLPNMFGLVQGEANAIAPGKRMLSAMSPTIVLDPAGQLLLVVGSRGGPRIITSTSQVVLNVIDHRMSLADAISAPRVHHQGLPDTLRFERDGLVPEVQDSLTAMGYAVSPYGGVGLVCAVMRVPGGWEGAVDPRGMGGSVGY